MNIIDTLRLHFAPEQALASGDNVWSTRDTLSSIVALPRRKHTVPCEP